MAIINGTEGNDRIVNYSNPPGDTAGDDTINTFGGDDVISTVGGFDTINAGDGNDELDDNVNGIIDMGAGNDFIYGFSSRSSSVNLGSGDDWLYIKAGADVVDTVTLGSGYDQVSLFRGGSYIFTDFNAGAGGDSVQFQEWFTTGGTRSDFWFDFAALGPDGIPNPFGTGFAQLIDSPAGALLQVRTSLSLPWTTLITFQGLTAAEFHPDNFRGWAPDGSPPAATNLNIVGGTDLGFLGVFKAPQDTYGSDVIHLADAGGTLRLTSGADVVYGGAGNDVVYGGSGESGFKTLYGGAGDDLLSAAGFEGYERGADGLPVRDTAWGLIYGGDGNDTVTGGWSNDELHGDDGDDSIAGGFGDDILDGGAGNDQLRGDGGNDRLDGGSGNDTLQGKTGTDMLTGGSGDDIFLGSAAEMNGDTITDFSAGDRIVISNATPGSFSFSLSGNTLNYTGGSLVLGSVPNGRLIAQAAPDGGVQLTLVGPAHNDFDGDGRSDILFQNTNGTVTDWLGRADSTFTGNAGKFSANLGTAWHVVGTGDFDGDGRADVLFQNSDGTVTDWLGRSDGTFTGNAGKFSVNLGTAWHVAGTGDFNGDGRADVLFQNSDGTVTDWLGRADGTFTGNAGTFSVNIGTAWHVVGTGDFNGDGREDVLFQNDNGTITDWLGRADGTFTGNASIFSTTLTSAWHVVATGDFNGDGMSDVLLRSDSGQVNEWLGQSNGSLAVNAAVANTVPAVWHVAGVGDFNGDGIDDVFWQNTDGTITDWLGRPDGTFTGNAYHFSANLGATWHVQDPFAHDPIA